MSTPPPGAGRPQRLPRPSFVGGFNVPMRGGFGRVNLSRPLARLELHPRRVDLIPRGPYRFVIAARSLPLEVIRVGYPLTHVLFNGPGIGLTCTDGAYYFWSRHAQEILELLESAGVPVDWTPRRVSARSLIIR
jgi:hypothetical protein